MAGSEYAVLIAVAMLSHLMIGSLARAYRSTIEVEAQFD